MVLVNVLVLVWLVLVALALFRVLVPVLVELMLVALVPYWFEHYDEVYEFTVLTGAVI